MIIKIEVIISYLDYPANHDSMSFNRREWEWIGWEKISDESCVYVNLTGLM